MIQLVHIRAKLLAHEIITCMFKKERENYWPTKWIQDLQDGLWSKEYLRIKLHLCDTEQYCTVATHPFTHQWFYSPLLGCGLFFSSIIIFIQTVGLLRRVISPSQSRYLHTGQHKHRINAHTDIHALSGIRTLDPSVRAGEVSSCFRRRGPLRSALLPLTETNFRWLTVVLEPHFLSFCSRLMILQWMSALKLHQREEVLSSLLSGHHVLVTLCCIVLWLNKSCWFYNKLESKVSQGSVVENRQR
jgi:hypothetical protein